MPPNAAELQRTPTWTAHRGSARPLQAASSERRQPHLGPRAAPNPANTVLMLSEKSNYKVFNILGEEILKGQGLSINISSIETGVYFVQIAGLNQTVRFIKN